MTPNARPPVLKVLKRLAVNAGEGRLATLEPGTYETRAFALDVPMEGALWALDSNGRALGWLSKAEAEAAERGGVIAF